MQIKHNLLKGFTLSEVMLVLSVIGVIAALTIPGIVQNLNDKQYKVAYKKAYTEIAQAYNAAMNNGELTYRGGQFDATASLSNFNAFKANFNILKDCNNNNNDQCWNKNGEHMTPAGGDYLTTGQPTQSEMAFIDASGFNWTLYYNAEDYILVDTNGFKGPNRIGKDRWIFHPEYSAAGSNGVAVNIDPMYKVDVLTPNWYCHEPPCYFASWLSAN